MGIKVIPDDTPLRTILLVLSTVGIALKSSPALRTVGSQPDPALHPPELASSVSITRKTITRFELR